MYTSLVIHPIDKGWVASSDFLREVLLYFGPNNSECHTIWGYKKAIEWNRNDIEEDFEVFNVPIDDAVKAYDDNKGVGFFSKKRLKCFIFFLYTDAFSICFYDELDKQQIVECYDDFSPNGISIHTGKHVIGNLSLDKTYAEFNFGIYMGSDGMPKDLIKYLDEVFKPSQTVQKLLKFLKECSGIEWTISYECSY